MLHLLIRNHIVLWQEVFRELLHFKHQTQVRIWEKIKHTQINKKSSRKPNFYFGNKLFVSSYYNKLLVFCNFENLFFFSFFFFFFTALSAPFSMISLMLCLSVWRFHSQADIQPQSIMASEDWLPVLVELYTEQL